MHNSKVQQKTNSIFSLNNFTTKLLSIFNIQKREINSIVYLFLLFIKILMKLRSTKKNYSYCFNVIKKMYCFTKKKKKKQILLYFVFTFIDIL